MVNFCVDERDLNVHVSVAYCARAAMILLWGLPTSPTSPVRNSTFKPTAMPLQLRLLACHTVDSAAGTDFSTSTHSAVCNGSAFPKAPTYLQAESGAVGGSKSRT